MDRGDETYTQRVVEDRTGTERVESSTQRVAENCCYFFSAELKLATRNWGLLNGHFMMNLNTFVNISVATA